MASRRWWRWPWVAALLPTPEQLWIRRCHLGTAIVRSLPALLTGGETDLTGTGTDDVTTTISPQGVRTQLFHGSKGPLLTIVFADPNDVTATGDLNQDGVLDFHFTGTLTGSVVDEVWSWDTNFDGTDDLRWHRTLDYSTFTFTLEVLELAPGQDGGPAAFQVISTRTDLMAEESAIVCPYSPPPNNLVAYGFPGDTSGPSFEPLGPYLANIMIVANGKPGSCTSDQAATVATAVQYAVADGLDCLWRSNPVVAALLANALAGSNWIIGCGLDIPGEGGYTMPGPAFWNYTALGPATCAYGTSLNLPEVAKTPTSLESIVLHEMLHWAGLDHFVTGSAEYTDEIYSCGRFCANCARADLPGGTTSDPAADCATCSDPAHKVACGIKAQNLVVDCAGVQHGAGAVCLNSQGQAAQCQTCLNQVYQYCDGTPYNPDIVYQDGYLCCAACPPTYPTNALSCGSVAPRVIQSCPKPVGCP